MTAAAAPPDPGGDPGRDPWYAPALPLTGRLDRHRQAVDGWRQRPRLALGAGLLAALVVAVGWWLGRPSSAGPIEGAIPFASAPAPAASGAGSGAGSPAGAAPTVTAVGGSPGSGPSAVTDDTGPAELVVHVAGAVVRPGIVRLAGGSRVVDAVDAAGGPAADADLDQLNLAAPLADGLQIRVPHQGETLPAPAGPIAGAGNGGSSGGATAGPPAVVDLNRATVAELEQLPGIGPSLAAAIVTWRQEHGGFKRVDDLLDVPGIGPAKLADLADRVAL